MDGAELMIPPAMPLERGPPPKNNGYALTPMSTQPVGGVPR